MFPSNKMQVWLCLPHMCVCVLAWSPYLISQFRVESSLSNWFGWCFVGAQINVSLVPSWFMGLSGTYLPVDVMRSLLYNWHPQRLLNAYLVVVALFVVIQVGLHVFFSNCPLTTVWFTVDSVNQRGFVWTSAKFGPIGKVRERKYK